MKKALYILSVIVVCVLLTLTMLFVLARDSKVQTAALQILANKITEQTNANISIDKLNYHLFNNIELNGVYVEDLQQDTLLYIDTLNAHFDFFGFFRRKIVFRSVNLHGTAVNIYHTDTVANYQFLIDAFSKNDKDTTSQPLPLVEVKNVSIQRLRLRYDDWHIDEFASDLALNHFSTDSIDAQISSLSLREREGFAISDLKVRAILTKRDAELRQMTLTLPRSDISMTSLIHFNDSIENSPVRFDIAKADVTLGDFGRLVPQLKNITGQMHMAGSITGTLKDMHAVGLELDYEDYEILRGDVSVVGLPKYDTAYIKANLQDLNIETALMQDFIADMKNKPFQLPPILKRLGNVHYQGVLDGRIDNLTLNGAFTSKLGSITTKGKLRSRKQFSELYFTGDVSTKRFALGRLLNQEDLGGIAFNIRLDAQMGDSLPLQANLQANIPYLQFRKYKYRNTGIEGLYREKEFVGKMSMNDDNLTFLFDGLVDLTQELPIANFTLNVEHLRMGELNLTDKYADSDLGFQLTLNGIGNSLDNANGYLYIDSLFFKRTEKELRMNQLAVFAETGENEPTNFKIQSDFLNANFSGQYVYSQLPLALSRLAAMYVPQMLSEKTLKKLQDTKPQNELTYYAYFRNIDLICDALDLPISIKKTPTIKGFLNEITGQFATQIAVPQLNTGNQKFENITLNLDNHKQQINLSVDAYKYASNNYAGKKMGDLKFFLKSIARKDSLYLNINFENTDSARTAGGLYTATRFGQYKHYPQFNINILPSQFMLMDSIWNIDESHLSYLVADTTLIVDAFRIGNDNHYIYADGRASRREEDSINVQLKDIILDYLLEYTNVKKSISFGGAITGSATAYSLFSHPMFDAEVWMMGADINGAPIGDVHAKAGLNQEEKTIDIWGAVTEKQDTVVRVDGLVNPKQSAWDLFIYPDSVNLGFINFWTKGILDDIAGRGTGEVHVYGRGKATHVEGKALAQNASLGVTYLGTRYHFTDTVYLDYDKIRFDDITLYDNDNHKLLLQGAVCHDGNFKNFTYNIEVSPQNAMVMNLEAKEQEMFYGKIYATGKAVIQGNDYLCKINANARTDANSVFSLSLATASTANNNNFITFVDHNIVATKTEEVTKKTEPKTRVYIDLQIEATRDALVNIIIDPKTGDQLQGRGEGDLKLTYDVNTNDIKLFGTYMLTSGKFYFTLENLIRKEFTLRNGSSVTFAGNPMNMQIDASAHYATSASLRDLFGSEYTNISTNRSTIPVNCIIYLKESLTNPLISFGIELPNSDESVTSQVRSVINTDEMMMREIIYLLVFNRFYTPEYLQTAGSDGLNETYSLLSSTVTGQINNWLRKLTNNFTVGFNVRADGEGDDSTQEYETQFQYQHNNRLIINGNFGYRYNDISNQPIFGNLDVEYLLTPSGMWRAKAYTHTVDKYSLREAHTVQGVGISFKYDFNAGKQAKKNKNKKEKN